jgi:hydroxyquinol 1,2-dioxygenase
MIIANEADLARAVLSEVERTSDPRLRRLLAAAVRHLHDFVRETELTEAEFRQICALIARTGQLTTASHNEVVLAAGSLGVSALVCLSNNAGSNGQATTANLMGPFWRKDSPVTPNGGSIVRSPTPGEPVFVKALVEDEEGRPVADAEVYVWQASGEGYYENQDPTQPDMNLRGKFRTDAKGCIEFRTVKPSGYPIPVSEAHDNEPAPDADVEGRWYSLQHRFVVMRGEAALPMPPITGKVAGAGARAEMVVLERRERWRRASS